jgi:uncharacterized membrane protein
MEIILFVLSWVLCGVAHFGLHFAYFQRTYALIAEETYESDLRHAMALSLLGPIALIAFLLFWFVNGKDWQGMKFY